MLEELVFLRSLLEKLQSGATGFELAHFVEENQKMKELICDGILFYSNFIEVGDEVYMNMPDKREVNFQTFKTLEDTEKIVLLNWIHEEIERIERVLSYEAGFDESAVAYERKKKRGTFIICSTCGTSITNDELEKCPTCGSKI